MQTLPAYKAGKRPIPRPDLVTYKSSSNENPYAPLDVVVQAVAHAAIHMNRYPDPMASEMVAALAARFDVEPDQIATGTGSVGILGQLIQAMVDAGQEVIFPWRSFEAYPIVTAVGGGVAVPVPLRDEHHDLDAMVAAVTPQTRIIFVCSPNNPTGTVVTQQAFDDFIAKVPQHVLVVIDEAYNEFVTDPDAVNGLAMLRKHENVAVLRSFAKAYGLAGMRVGVCIAQREVAEALRKTAVPFGVSEMAQVAVLTSLQHEKELIERVNNIITQRERVVAEVRALGVAMAEQQANFIWLRLGSRTSDFVQRCEEAGVVVRPFLEGDDQGAGVRITVGEPQADERVLAVLRGLVG